MTTVIDDLAIIRLLREEDIETVVRIDAAATGRHRPRYFELILQRALSFAGLQVSLVAEIDGRVAGYLIGSMDYGEYGRTEPSASIDAIGVAEDSRRQRVAWALLRQFAENVAAIGAVSIRTEVDWDDFDLLQFFRSEGFAPSRRLCLERPCRPV